MIQISTPNVIKIPRSAYKYPLGALNDDKNSPQKEAQVEIIGYISGILLALCGLPLAISAIRHKFVEIDISFLTMWTIGEILGLGYALHLGKYPLILNYTVNTICLVIVWFYRRNR